MDRVMWKHSSGTYLDPETCNHSNLDKTVSGKVWSRTVG